MNVTAAMVRPMAITISNSRSENPRFFLNVINLFRGGGGARRTLSRSDRAREPAWVRTKISPLRGDNTGVSRSLIASCFMLGRGWGGVKARQCNARVLAFCHLQRLPMVAIDGRTLRGVPSVRR